MRFQETLANTEARDIPAAGNFIYCDTATRIRVKAGNAIWELSSRQGVKVDETFDSVTVENISGVSEEIKLRAGFGQLIVSGEGQAVEVTNAVSIDDAVPLKVKINGEEIANTITDAVDVTLTAAVATVLAAANTGRKELLVKNPSSNTDTIRVGSGSVAASRGHPLEPGESIVLTVTAAVYGYCANAVSLSVTELEYV